MTKDIITSDSYDRLTKKSYTIDGTTLNFSYTYNANGQLASKTFPDGMTENYTYDAYGNLTCIKMGSTRVWELSTYSGTSRTAYLGTAPLTLTKSYSTNGLLTGTSIKKSSSTLHSFTYTFDGATGNLKSRTGMQSGSESFAYDLFDRLTTGTTYRLSGNIASKTGLGNYTYDASKKHAVTQVASSTGLVSGTASLTYNAFNKVSKVALGTNTLTITYGPTRQRCKTVLENNGNKTTIIYMDNMEMSNVNGTVYKYHYVSSPDGLVAVYVTTGSTSTPYYVETDHLGSICKIYDANGNQKFSAAYDPWGKQTVNTNTLGITRGYCAHEHWNQFGLIDMNGRFYDPVVGRFLSPDPYVQDPGNPQNFNRYSYCLNNPLKYNDPSGEFVVSAAIIMGTLAGIAMGMFQADWNGHSWGDGSYWRYMTCGGVIGAASGAAGAYVGSTVGGYFAGSSFVAGAASGAAAGAVSGTISGTGYSWLNGASFRQGAWKGFVSGNVGALTGGLLGGIAGGIDAYCDGRNAWTGKEVAMGRSRLAFNNTDLPANKYQVGPGEVRSLNYINEEMASSNPKYDYAKYGKVDKNGLSTGTISKYQNYTMESREYEVFQNFKGRAYLEVKSTGTFDVSFSLDGKIITPDSNGLFHLPQGCKLLQINMIRSETSSLVNAVSPLRFTIQGYSIP